MDRSSNKVQFINKKYHTKKYNFLYLIIIKDNT